MSIISYLLLSVHLVVLWVVISKSWEGLTQAAESEIDDTAYHRVLRYFITELVSVNALSAIATTYYLDQHDTANGICVLLGLTGLMVTLRIFFKGGKPC